MTTDCELLRRYAETGDQAAFTEVVRQNVDLVYSAALRQVGGNAHHAQDVTQNVFATLARQARALSRHPSITGWLYTTTKFTACKLISGERRRFAREQEAFTMQETTQVPEPNWALLRPMLDEAVCQLEASDREAVLMRFFQNKSHREVGDVLGVSEDTARKRVERALEKLRADFASRGVTVSSTLLATALAENSVQAAPSGLAESVAGFSLAGNGWGIGAGVATASIFLKFLLMHPKTAILLAGATISIVAATWFLNPRSAQKTTAVATAKGQVAAPRLPPAAVTSATPEPNTGPDAISQPTDVPAAAPDAPTVDPRNDLKTALQELARLERANDDLTALEEFTPPDSELMKTVQELKQQREANYA
jgi:RNA polymerase sigma factor (sigma-70 family)